MNHPTLTTPLQVRGGLLRNRVVMGSMHTGLEDRPWHLDELAAFYRERAAGGVGLIVTGGYSPTLAGSLTPFGSVMADPITARAHRRVTERVHGEGASIILQLLHAGRYGVTPLVVSASKSRSPISKFTARELSDRGVEATINAYVRSAQLARVGGYDGVEIMGSEGYLINQFLAERTNHRTDRWGGSPQNRRRFPVEIVKRIRARLGEDFLISYRISLIDLVEGGQSWQDVVALAHELEQAGVSLFNTGIGWHESRVPTIITQVPPGAWTDLTAALRGAVTVPVAASNRINTPELAQQLLDDGSADLVAMARPLLADPEFVAKVATGRTDEINTCIACNQACLDKIFVGQRASCLVNPRAGRETTLKLTPIESRQTVAVVGAGPAGLAAAVSAAERGFRVTLFEASDAIGGQFRLAQRVPGKADFAQTLRYFGRRLQVLGVQVKLNTRAEAASLVGFDQVVLATGVTPRIPELAGVDHPSVVTYADLLSGRASAGQKVAVIGAGGIGVDVAHWLTHSAEADQPDRWRHRWGVATTAEFSADELSGGLIDKQVPASPREVWLLQRKDTPIGRGLGKTSGWVHRLNLRDTGVHQLVGVSYQGIDDDGLQIEIDGVAQTLQVDTVVLCSGQESVRDLVDDLPAAAVIGGAALAAELDAERAIRQGTEWAAALPANPSAHHNSPSGGS